MKSPRRWLLVAVAALSMNCSNGDTVAAQQEGGEAGAGGLAGPGEEDGTRCAVLHADASLGGSSVAVDVDEATHHPRSPTVQERRPSPLPARPGVSRLRG